MTEHPHVHPTAGTSARTSRAAMAALVGDLIDGLDAGQRRSAIWPFESDERFNWHYVPRQRAGLPIGRLGEAARRAFDALLRHSLSEAGYDKVTGILAVEEVLGAIEGRPELRDPGNYAFTLFGTPGRGAWGWRLEGHHLSLNFTALDEWVIAVVPTFLGSNPGRVPEGFAIAGHRVLGRETDLAFALIRGLDEAARERAIISETSLGNIVTGPGRERLVEVQEGLPLAEMPEGLRERAVGLLETYASNFHPEIAAREIQRLREAGLERVHFAWGGPLDDGHAHYWRLHGPVSLIEFDNTQNDANHIHSVWHDLERNFGRDLLAEHYAHGHAHHPG